VISDDDLLEAWRAGDQRAGKQLFTRHYAGIDRFFRNKVGDESSDLAQKTFLGCLEAVDRYTNEHNFRSWLFAIAYRQLCKHHRTRASERARFDFGSVTAHDVDPSPSLVVAKSEEQRLLLEALRQIPIDMQVTLELHYWERMSDAEIARALELPLGTVKSRIRRARQLLTEQLKSLSTSPAQLNSTLANLDAWAAQLRDVALRGSS
jgi:RNA polymerase sigma-70 factor (ECF subfamily)